MMREAPTSNCEKDFILKLIEQRKRLDGRGAFDCRPLTIAFGLERGRCHACLGNTRVMAQVSCSVAQPKQARPNEGMLYVNVEQSPMACPSWDASGSGRPGGVQLSRQLERCLKESKCVDVESLCIVAEEKVWQVRVDVHILNHEGNILDCASVAAISALAHFRRPDFTVTGKDIVIHKPEEKEPIPLSIHHMPVAVSFALIQNGKFMLMDPLLLEEKVMDGLIVIAMNKHREICSLHVSGAVTIHRDTVLRCSGVAAAKVEAITELINSALKQDAFARGKGLPLVFDGVFGSEVNAVSHLRPATEVTVDDDAAMSDGGAASQEEGVCSAKIDVSYKLTQRDSGGVAVGNHTAVNGSGHSHVVGEGGPSTWGIEALGVHSSRATGSAAAVKPIVAGGSVTRRQNKEDSIGDSHSSSEEEETVVLAGMD